MRRDRLFSPPRNSVSTGHPLAGFWVTAIGRIGGDHGVPGGRFARTNMPSKPVVVSNIAERESSCRIPRAVNNAAVTSAGAKFGRLSQLHFGLRTGILLNLA